MMHTIRKSARSGVTLVELLVAIVLVALAAGIAVASAGDGSGRPRAPADENAARINSQIASARRKALRSGQEVVVRIDDEMEVRGDDTSSSGAVFVATALPDGSVVMDSLRSRVVAWDRLTGKFRKEATRATP
jgi:prepilin-type N-terminal cleavage/methylation domain-containing protein